MSSRGRGQQWRKLSDALRAAQDCHTWEVNCGLRSDTISLGMPWRRKTCLISSSPVSAAMGIFDRGIKWAAFEKQSTMVNITVCPSDGRSPRRCEARDVMEPTVGGEAPQETDVRTSREHTQDRLRYTPLCHGSLLTTKSVAAGDAGWDSNQDDMLVWTHAPTAGPWNRQHPGRIGRLVTAPTTQKEGIMSLGSGSGWSVENWRDSASGFVFFEPGRSVRMKSIVHLPA